MIETINFDNIDDRVLIRAKKILDNNGLICVPTDTSFSIVCSPNSKHGIDKLKSLKGKGTQFTVCLPMELLPEQTGTASAKAAAPCDFTGRKVLLCEDNELNIEIAEMLLTSWKLTVVCAKDGQEGVERFAASAPGEFAAVLMDIHMPVLDGYAATRQIRLLARPDASSVPIIAMTADAYAEDVQRCLAAGMNAHVAKPIDAAVLHQTLADIWKEKEAQPS